MVLAPALWATGNRQVRRAAWRGLGSIAAASTTADVIGKGLTGRRRPYADVPVRSRLRRVPRSSSFPSGHAANAAARSVDVRAVDGQRIWLSTDGEVATAESGFIHGKHPHALVVYRKADD